MAEPRWFILGPGALGCLWASMLAAAGADVVLAGRDRLPAPSQGKQLTLRYRSIFAPSTEQAFTVTATCPAAMRKAGVSIARLLVTTKAYDAVGALRTILDLLSEDACVVTLCNGLGFHEKYLALLGGLQPGQKNRRQYYAATSSEGALLERPAQVLHTGRGLTRVGPYPQGGPPAGIHGGALELSRLLPFPETLPLACEYASNIKIAVLQKAMVNCAINPLTALFRCRNGELLDNPLYYARFLELCNELQDVYNVLVSEPGKIANAYTADAGTSRDVPAFDVLASACGIARATAANQSSMLRDFMARRPLELEAMNIHVVKLAAQLSMDCPINRLLIHQLQSETAA